MKIALAAVGFITNDTAYNVEKIKTLIEKYASEVDLILFGESFLQGFECLSWDYAKDVNIAVHQDSELINDIRAMCEINRVSVSFGYIEKDEDNLYSSQLTIDKNGETVDNFRRVSIGWKEPIADFHYVEGKGFGQFTYLDKTVSVALCGDLWYEDNCIQMKNLDSDIVLWPVYTDFDSQEWNESMKHEYAEQAEKCGNNILYVNSYCLDQNSQGIARGGAALFSQGKIESEIPAGIEGVLVVEA
ncbi:carbon-nitrogen hydrolase family protein [Granulicatella elegans]|uniref:carbon-nitrogen hydrolase family protein n=1 Tax=Granulicatella elegans TaxID=137732 RepID=UPI001D15A5F7|nr:carbon-nitrogen hydrolase family protein [Granulicatella elegans]UEA31192.1 carbon-nitrogen hydrolase family protein [Granulicatella elegans]